MTLHSPVFEHYEATSIDEIHSMLESLGGLRTVLAETGRSDHYYRQERLDFGALRMDALVAILGARHRVQPPERFLVARVEGGHLTCTTAGVERQASRGDLFLVALPEQEYVSQIDVARGRLVAVAPALVASVAGHMPRPEDFCLDPLHPQDAARWNQTMEFVLTIAGTPEAHNDLVLGQAGRLVAATMLTLFAAARKVEMAPERSDPSSATLRRALSYIDANPDLDIGLRDIARAARASTRAVQLAFRNRLDTTPTAYLRRVRLDRVRQELLDGDPSAGARVGKIASRWGFVRASRLSADYRSAYGETPRQTLHR